MQEIRREDLIPGTEYYFEIVYNPILPDLCTRYIGTFWRTDKSLREDFFKNVRCVNPDKWLPGLSNWGEIRDIYSLSYNKTCRFYKKFPEERIKRSNDQLYKEAFKQVLEEVIKDPYMTEVEARNYFGDEPPPLGQEPALSPEDQKKKIPFLGPSPEDQKRKSQEIKKFVQNELSKRKPATDAAAPDAAAPDAAAPDAAAPDAAAPDAAAPDTAAPDTAAPDAAAADAVPSINFFGETPYNKAYRERQKLKKEIEMVNMKKKGGTRRRLKIRKSRKSRKGRKSKKNKKSRKSRKSRKEKK